jgi:protein-L-isoaspartate(D-aspartate) O-methyltransferase
MHTTYGEIRDARDMRCHVRLMRLSGPSEHMRAAHTRIRGAHAAGLLGALTLRSVSFTNRRRPWERGVTKAVTVTDSRQADELREAMTDQLVADGWIVSPVVEAAFRAVPRHLFVPAGTSLEDAYGTKVMPITKRDEHGAHLSSVSAPWVQARMIAQAGIEPGMKVLEIGSGGYNAALLAEVTGERGRVVSVDIDREITDRASAALDATGYAGRVTVVTADGEYGEPGHAPYDAIIVTVGAWDIPPAWLEQLADDGVIVVPMRMNEITRSIAFHRSASHLASTSVEQCGFVAMQGIGARKERTFRLADPAGGYVELRFDQDEPRVPGLLDALTAGPVTEWSGVTIAQGMSFADLNLWLAAFLPGFCKVSAGGGTGLATEGIMKAWFPYGGAIDDSLAVLALRKTGETGAEFEFGAKAYGEHAAVASGALLDQIRAWDRAGREVPETGFAFWPAGAAISPQPEHTAVFRKTHGSVIVTWATPSQS